MQRRQILQVASFSLVSPICAMAQSEYPSKAIKFVVPYGAGGFPDTVARMYAQRLSAKWGQGVLIDNKPGANGVVAAQAISGSPADGYTFLVTDGSMFSINPRIYKTLNYDLNKDFVPVSMMARAPLFLAVHPSLGVNTLDEFIALAKAKPGMLNYGSSGVGSTHHLCHEAMNAALGLDIKHVPFKGTSQSVPALVGGQVQAVFSAMPSIGGFVKAGQLKVLAVNAVSRSPLAPNLPTIGELVPGFDFAPMVGIFAAKGTSAAIVNKISSEIAAIAKTPELASLMGNGGMDAVGGTPADYLKAVLAENERFGKAITAAGIKAE